MAEKITPYFYVALFILSLPFFVASFMAFLLVAELIELSFNILLYVFIPLVTVGIGLIMMQALLSINGNKPERGR